MAKKEELDIDWNDEKAVAAARGDKLEDTAADPDETPITDEEGEDNGLQDEGEEEGADAKKEEVEGDDKKANDKKEPMIPKSRYDSKAAENRTLKERLAQIEREKAENQKKQAKEVETQTVESEIDALEDQYMEAISKDEMDKAKALRKEIRAKERQMFQSEIAENSDKTTDRTREQIRLDMTIDAIEQDHPEFNPDSDDYDAELVSKVQELRTGFEATGRYTQTQALLKAMEYTMPKKDVAKSVATDKQVDNEADARRKAGLKKATDAANKQPPKTDSVGEDSDAMGKNEDLNVDKLSYSDVASLPESTLRRLRGDYAA